MKAKNTRITKKKPLMTENMQKCFLDLYQDNMNFTESCKALEIDPRTVISFKNKNKEFSAKFKEVEDLILENLFAILYDRAVNGVEEAIVYKGEIQDETIRKIDKEYLFKLISKLDPTFNQSKSQIEHVGAVTHSHDFTAAKENLLKNVEGMLERGVTIDHETPD